MFDQTTSRELATATSQAAKGTEEEKLTVSLQSSAGGLKPSVTTDSLAEGLKSVCVPDLEAKQALCDAKMRFNEARRNPTEAFSKEALETSDRILAMTIRVMATLLANVDNPITALAACRLCLDELRNMQALQKSFKIELSKGFKSLLNRSEVVKLLPIFFVLIS